MIKNKQGYTLIELLVVLTIVFMLITITSASFSPLLKRMQIQHFFDQLQLDVSYAQMYAMNHFKDVRIVFYPQEHRYVISAGIIEPILIRRFYPDNIHLELLTLPATVTFIANGSIRRAGKIFVRYEEEEYYFVFLFGKGQTYVKKL